MRPVPLFMIAGLLATAIPLMADEAPPIDPGLKEQVDVKLVILDVQVLDKKGNSIPGMTPADFSVAVDMRPVPLVAVDTACEATAKKPGIVLAFDYQHLDESQRGQIVRDVELALERGSAADTEIMVAALTGSLRIEQPFTRDRSAVLASLKHMGKDPSLFAGNFAHTSDKGLVRGLGDLFAALGPVPGSKAVIYYSAMGDVPLEEHFRELAAQAAAARAAVYPFHVEKLIGDGPSKETFHDEYRRHGDGPEISDPARDKAMVTEHREQPDVNIPHSTEWANLVNNPGCG